MNEYDIIETNWDEKITSFDSIGIKEELLRGIYSFGFENPSEIQQLAIKPILMGKDIVAQARSGTGKTGAFGIGLLNQIDVEKDFTQALILAPTRELVEQITNVLSQFSTYLKIKIAGFIGGKTIRNDIVKLHKGIHVAIGTPGRIHDLIEKKFLNIERIKIFIMDETDEMLSKEFIEQVQKIFIELDEEVQVGLFSATFTNEVKEITKLMMKNPSETVKIYIPLYEQTLDGIQQFNINSDKKNKIEIIKKLYKSVNIGTCIIFCNSIKTVDVLENTLLNDNFPVGSIHSGMTQVEREEKLKQLRLGKIRLLITTDILSRGVDVQQLSMAINYDLPFEPSTYIHRIGRCGRFGRKGIAINLINSKDYYKINFIKKIYSTTIKEIASDLNYKLNFFMR